MYAVAWPNTVAFIHLPAIVRSDRARCAERAPSERALRHAGKPAETFIKNSDGKAKRICFRTTGSTFRTYRRSRWGRRRRRRWVAPRPVRPPGASCWRAASRPQLVPARGLRAAALRRHLGSASRKCGVRRRTTSGIGADGLEDERTTTISQGRGNRRPRDHHAAALDASARRRASSNPTSDRAPTAPVLEKCSRLRRRPAGAASYCRRVRESTSR